MKIKCYCALLLVAYVSFLLHACKRPNRNGIVVITGQLKGLNGEASIEGPSELAGILPPSPKQVIIPDHNGNFTIRIDVAIPDYYWLGENQLYLSPGDSIHAFIDLNDPENSTFQGVGSEANNYLREVPFPKVGSYLYRIGMQPVTKNIDSAILTIKERAKQQEEDLATLKDVSDEFRRLETARIKADIINSLYHVIDRGVDFTKENYKKQLDDNKKMVQPVINFYSKGFVDSSLMKLNVYRDIAIELVKQGGKPADMQAIKDWYTASDLVDSMQQINDKQQLLSFGSAIAAIRTKSYKNACDKMLTYLLSFGKGDNAIDFVAADSSGKAVSLSNLKGKIIYIDIWATWCGPCMQELPHFENIKEKYKNNADIAFVSLSIDNDEAKWKKELTGREMNGYQWWININKLLAYNIVRIPRALLFDKNFKIVDMNAPLPSSKNLDVEIDKLLRDK